MNVRAIAFLPKTHHNHKNRQLIALAAVQEPEPLADCLQAAISRQGPR